MLNFFDLALNEKKVASEYLEAMQPSIKKMMIENLLEEAKQVIEIIRYGLPHPPDESIIKISSDKNFSAAGMEGMIEISQGLIDYCLDLPALPLQDVVAIGKLDPPLPRLMPNPLFAWAIAHEYWHGIRRHNMVLDQVSGSAENLKAIEVDADLCAAASIYRWFQKNMSENYSDLIIRQVVFALLFWAMRNLPKDNSSESHPDVFERIYYVTLKIVQIDKLGGYVDPAKLTAESEAYIEPLLNVAVKAEKFFKSQNPDDQLSFIEFLKSFLEKKGWDSFSQPWDEMRDLVSVASGTRT